MLLSQRYALATNAILNRTNEHAIYLLGGVELSSNWVQPIKNSLDKWWGIKDANECRDTLQWLCEAGHSTEYENAVATVRATQAKLGARFTPAALATDEERMAARFSNAIGKRALIAWDAGRLVNVAGWGYIAGYLSEHEAWQYVVNTGTVVQRVYDSWAEFGQHYMIGRAFWGGHDEKIEAMVNALLTEEESPWVCIPWNTDLTVPGVPVKLGPYWTKVLQSFPARPKAIGQPPKIQPKSYPSSVRLVRQADGADLVEEDGKQEWRDCYDNSMTRDQLLDDWGPLKRDMSKLESIFATLEQFTLHDTTFRELEKKDALAAEKAILAFGYRSVGHFFRVSLTAIKHYGTPYAASMAFTAFDSQDCQNAMRKVHAQLQQQQQRAVLDQSPGLSAPIMGITLETYAMLSAKQAAGMPEGQFNTLLAQHKIDLAGYQKVAQAWMDRIQKDSTATLGRHYGQLYMQNAGGQYGAAGQAAGAASVAGVAASGAEPIPFEKYCEIAGAMTAWGEQGIDMNTEITRVFGISMIDYGNIASFWSTRMGTDQMLMRKYMRIVDNFAKQYSGGTRAGDEDDDLDDEPKCHDDDDDDKDDDNDDDDDKDDDE